MILRRACSARIKAVGPDTGSASPGGGLSALEEGQFRALVAVFGNVDSYGDVILPGAFSDDVARWAAGDVLPVVWSHQWTDPFAHIGEALSAQETTEGLEVVGQLDLDNPTGEQVYKLLKGRRVSQFSFAFDLLDGGWGVREDANGEPVEVFEIRKVRTHEVGPCLVGVNQSTELIDVKSRPASLSEEELAELTLAAY